MRSAAFAAAFIVSSAPVVAVAQTSEWRPDLIAAYESQGGQNVPNFKFDGPAGPHSAGGVCQMLTSTWQRIAPTVDIDIAKFPVAGSAPEFEQWQACWKLWAVEGYSPWTCCNPKLRQALGHREAVAAPAAPRSFRSWYVQTRPSDTSDKTTSQPSSTSAVDLSGLKYSHTDERPAVALNIFSSD